MLWTLFVINKITQGLKKNEECCKHVLIKVIYSTGLLCLINILTQFMF